MEIKNTKHIKAYSVEKYDVDKYEVVVRRHRRDKISKEYLDNLYRWTILNDLYLDELFIPKSDKFGHQQSDSDYYEMWFKKYSTVQQDEIGLNDNCRGLDYRTFGYMPDYELRKQDPRDRS